MADTDSLYRTVENAAYAEILAGLATQTTPAGISWSHAATTRLIQVVKDLQPVFFSAGRKIDAWRQVAMKLSEEGYIYTSDDCDKKMRGLKHRHKMISEGNKTGKKRKTWEYFELMEDLQKRQDNPHTYISTAQDQQSIPHVHAVSTGQPQTSLPLPQVSHPHQVPPSPQHLGHTQQGHSQQGHTQQGHSQQFAHLLHVDHTQQASHIHHASHTPCSQQASHTQQASQPLQAGLSQQACQPQQGNQPPQPGLAPLTASSPRVSPPQQAGLSQQGNKIHQASQPNQPSVPVSSVQASELLQPTTNPVLNWSRAATTLLITVCKDMQPLFQGSGRKTDVWRSISSKLAENGYNYSANECDKKMRGLKHRYKMIVDNGRKTGKTRSTWYYFELMEKLHGENTRLAPAPVTTGTQPFPTIILTPGPRGKKGKDDWTEQIAELIKQQTIANELSRERNTILKSLVDCITKKQQS